MIPRNRTATGYTEADYDAVLGYVYEAALHPENWGDVLLRIGRPINAHAGQLIVAADDVSDYYENVLVGIDDLDKGLPQFDELIASGTHLRANAVQRTPEMATVTDYMHTSPREMKRHPFYQDHVCPFGIPYYGGTVIKHSADTLIACVLFRSKRAGHFTDAEVAYLNRLAPHIRRSLELSFQLPSEGMVDGVMSTLARLRCGGIVVGPHASIVAMNEKAAHILGQKDGVTDAAGHLYLADPGADRRLRDELKHALGHGQSTSVKGSGWIRVQRLTGRSPYTIVVAPLRDRRETMFRKRHAMVLVVDPEEDFRFPRGFLAQAFGLTPAESGVVKLLVAGRTVRQIAESRGCSVETVRSQLKKVFEKTGCRNQAELVSTLPRELWVAIDVD